MIAYNPESTYTVQGRTIFEQKYTVKMFYFQDDQFMSSVPELQFAYCLTSIGKEKLKQNSPLSVIADSPPNADY